METQTVTSTLRNNIFFGQLVTPVKIDSATDGGVEYGYNLFNTCAQVTSGACPADWHDGSLSPASNVHDNLINVDPRFSNPANGDYTLLPGSVAIDAGDPTTINERGLDGLIPQRADIGAFETELARDSADTPFQESNGQVVMEAEHFTWYLRHGNRAWVSQTNLADYQGPGYMSALPDTDLQFAITNTITNPELQYTINFTTTGAYTIWLRGYAPNAAGDSLYMSLDDQPVTILTGFIPQGWNWANNTTSRDAVTIEITQPGLHTLHLWQREDGLRLDRIVLTTDNSYIPTGDDDLLESDRITNITP